MLPFVNKKKQTIIHAHTHDVKLKIYPRNFDKYLTWLRKFKLKSCTSLKKKINYQIIKKKAKRFKPKHFASFTNNRLIITPIKANKIIKKKKFKKKKKKIFRLTKKEKRKHILKLKKNKFKRKIDRKTTKLKLFVFKENYYKLNKRPLVSLLNKKKIKLPKRKVFIKENKKKYLFYKFAKRFIEKKKRNLNDLQIKQIKFIRTYNKKFG